MRNLLVAAAAALTLAACGGDRDEADTNAAADANMAATDNMMMDHNMMNGAMDANMAHDPATQNLIEQDLNTNAPDTNLANGL